MIGIDTNILAYARIEAAPLHGRAVEFLEGLVASQEVVISELVLMELYLLLRNEKVLSPPLSASEAVNECQVLRAHPRWQLVDSADVMKEVWPIAEKEGFARRRIFDVRLAKTLQAHGVTEFATANTKDFEGLGFQRVWNPLITSL
jgi:toxin-antitoxin system PIN domain toxin